MQLFIRLTVKLQTFLSPFQRKTPLQGYETIAKITDTNVLISYKNNNITTFNNFAHTFGSNKPLTALLQNCLCLKQHK